MRTISIVLIALVLAACQASQRINALQVPAPAGAPAIASATFCEVAAAEGGAIPWAKANSRAQKERIALFDADWKQCPEYHATAPGMAK